MLLSLPRAYAADTADSSDLVCQASPPELKAAGLLKADRLSDLVTVPRWNRGDGGLCQSVVYEVTAPVTVYRLSACSKEGKPDYFNWWSLENPSGSASEYRRRNVMCSGWAVEMKTICRLRIGTRIAVGYGQRYDQCDGGLAASATLQVFVAGNPLEIEKQLDGCTTERGLTDP